MKIAVEGCCHGELDKIYATLEELEKRNSFKVDLLLICGDFQSVRNQADLECMAVPQSYRQMQTFYKYYSGEKVAPVLTIFIGGNHEASNYLQQLPYGGWVAPKVYYMGYANVVQFGGIRIGGLSGIFKGKDYMKGHFEHPPYSEDSKRSAYHIRNLEVYRLKQLKQHVDIFLTHDWPRGIYNYGNVRQLLKKKKFLRQEVEEDRLGSPPAAELLHHLQPSYWFSAHLHVKFAAMVKHSMADDARVTKFLSLDKCLPQRQFLQIVDIPHDSSKPMRLQLDAEWLAILKSTNHMLSLSKAHNYNVSSGPRKDYTPTREEINDVIADFGGNLMIPENFTITVPAYNPSRSKALNQCGQPKIEINPQTTLLCSMLDLTDPNAVFLGRDSTYKLVNDQEGADDNSGESDDDVVDDDIDSDASFMSASESDRSFSDRSYSFPSARMDSPLSLGGGNNGAANEGNGASNEKDPQLSDKTDRIAGQSGIKRDGSGDGLSNSVSESPLFIPQRLGSQGKRLSLSERLKNCTPSEGSNSPGSKSGSPLKVMDDDEFAAIMSAQKLEKSGSSIESECEASKNSVGSLDSNSVEEIGDDDAELREMLTAQKSVQENKDGGQGHEASDKEVLENQEIIATPKKNEAVKGDDYEIQRDFELGPVVQSSPIVKIDGEMGDNDKNDSSPGQKRQDIEEKSQGMKKFKRRNQDLYVSPTDEQVWML